MTELQLAQVGYQIKYDFNHNLNILFNFENFKIFGVPESKKCNKCLKKVARIQVGYQIKEKFIQSMNIVFTSENIKILRHQNVYYHFEKTVKLMVSISIKEMMF